MQRRDTGLEMRGRYFDSTSTLLNATAALHLRSGAALSDTYDPTSGIRGPATSLSFGLSSRGARLLHWQANRMADQREAVGAGA